MRSNQVVTEQARSESVQLRVPQCDEHFSGRCGDAGRNFATPRREDKELYGGLVSDGWRCLNSAYRGEGKYTDY